MTDAEMVRIREAEDFPNIMSLIEYEINVEMEVEADVKELEVYSCDDVSECFTRDYVEKQWALLLGINYNGPTTTRRII